MTMNPVVHFEMPAVDRQRMIAFYSAAFGWKLRQLGPEMGDYVLATTTETGPDGRPITAGAINGGFFQRTDDPKTRSTLLTIAVDDIHAHIAIVKKAGGTVDGEPMDIPGVGWYVAFVDTEGNRGSLLQPHAR